MARKVAKVIVLFKKGDKDQPNNYSPIRLLFASTEYLKIYFVND